MNSEIVSLSWHSAAETELYGLYLHCAVYPPFADTADIVMTRIEKEKRTVSLMIRIYCRRNCGTRTGLCKECSELEKYAHARLDGCRYGNGKGSCRRCPVHCYRPDMRDRIKAVMRFSGPRMLLYEPVEALRHLCDSVRR